jgi:hypothetical protein
MIGPQPDRGVQPHVEGSREANKTISAERARQGEIVLRTRARRLVFFGGLALLAVIGIVLRFAG